MQAADKTTQWTNAPEAHAENPARFGVVVFGDFDSPVSLADIEAVADGRADVALHESVRARAKQSENFLNHLIKDRHCIYGVTTGYGPLADNQIDPSHGSQLQRNLVYHLATGVGAPFAQREARAIMAARLQTLTQGMSAVRPDLLHMLQSVLNAGLGAVIPEKGTVGASGDLTPLSHMALALMGEGAFTHAGKPISTHDSFSRIGMPPLALFHKEGLALVNGTSVMTAIAALNGVMLRRLLRFSVLLNVANAEIFGGHRSAWHPHVGRARRQPGQTALHEILWQLTADAQRLIAHTDLPPKIHSATDVGGVAHEQPQPQDPYSIRCVPQLLGAVLDMLNHHDSVVEIEVSAVTDNPLVFAGEGIVLHGGNFFGQHVSFVSDSLTNASITMAVLAERQIARITDYRRNEGLPPFLQGKTTGLNSGFMGAQVTATALVAEMRTKATPASIQSIPTNADNQDVVTMGTIAARRARDILSDVRHVLAISALCMAQAVEVREQQTGSTAFSAATRALRDAVRQRSAFLADDRPLSGDITSMADWLGSAGCDALLACVTLR
jgi:tyrosine ammonia-lyase